MISLIITIIIILLFLFLILVFYLELFYVFSVKNFSNSTLFRQQKTLYQNFFPIFLLTKDNKNLSIKDSSKFEVFFSHMIKIFQKSVLISSAFVKIYILNPIPH